ncbi:predicted protein [Aspergillus terreus NIH2624]|uniref:Short chain dehydrogenase pgmD n=1 Tax=Aspergillus terreus (strain NIH 2624 / FGSC A1156) TaxID=341663 RepID=PGMD_ASPTN|nr:uncharacterized protein ATEG_06207 [Aspergillus terreus NIH2624]Q0CJC7.1 RecName: Full=Short chain dehydrogenase pgmD; AltName: Full=Pigmented naphthoquinones biosynthesis cluster protein D [Aspergillus terreus NIH2624]EAU33968.1 predicted protein [Aspergillus terreus NIH2624]
MAQPELDLSKAPAHWGMNFTETTHQQPSRRIDPSNVTFPQGYTVVVIGAGKGIGEHIAKAYVQARAENIVITSRTGSDLDRVKKELETLAQQTGQAVKVSTLVQDATKPESYTKLKDLLEEGFNGRLDTLVFCAGGGPVGTLWTPHIDETDVDEWNESIALNFTGSYYAAKYLVPLMLRPQSHGKTIVNITSAASHFTGGNITPASYSIGKLALNRFTQILGENYADQGLVVVAVHPGSSPTPGALGSMPPSLHNILTDDQGLCGAVCVWISKEKRDWISGRYICATWDMDDLESKKEEIVKEDKLKWRMAV